MKKIVTGILALATFIFSANAQQPGKMKHHKRQNQMGMAMKDINLSDAQKAQMKANRESTKDRVKELKKNEKITVKEFKERKKDIRKSQKEQMDKLLTPEQKNQVAQNEKAQQEKRQQHSAKKINKMKTNLSLSDAQMSQLKANRDANQVKVKAIKENEELSKSEKKEQLMTLKETQKKTITQVLTPEQMNKMEETKKNHKEKSRRK